MIERIKKRVLAFPHILVASVLCAAISFGASVPFDGDRGLVEVPITINNFVDGSFGVDTGADRLYIDRTFALRHNLIDASIPAQRVVSGVDGSTTAMFTTLRSLAIGDERLYNVKATVIDINELNKERDGLHPDGLIGHEILRRLYVTVDYPGRSIDLQVDRPRFMSGRNYEQVSFKPRKHLIIVDVTFDNGITRPMMLDYCASVTSVSKKLAGEIGLSDDPNEIQIVKEMSIDGVIETDNVAVAVADLSGYRRALKGIAFEGILGGTFLCSHKITINYKQSKIYLHR